MKTGMFLILFLILSTYNLFTQNLKWINYTNGDDIIAISQEGNYIWIETTGGIVKIDKISGEKDFYDHDPELILINFPSAIDRLGNKWAVVSDGLVYYDGNNFTFFDSSNSGLPDDRISCIAIDDSNNKWIGTSKGLVKYNDSDWIIFDTTNSDINPKVFQKKRGIQYPPF